MQIAAKMLIHFIGDIGQPLHCENIALGGNYIDVTYDGDDTNLHRIWDSEIPESVSGGSSKSIAKQWASTLSTAIRSGTYANVSSSWVSNEKLDVAEPLDAAMAWATESNAYVCTDVLAEGVDWVESHDLAGEYTDDAQPVVSQQISKQGYRLAKWLDAIVAAM